MIKKPDKKKLPSPDAIMLRRNRFGFRLRRRSLSNRLLQVLVVLGVLALFFYFLLYAMRLQVGRERHNWFPIK